MDPFSIIGVNAVRVSRTLADGSPDTGNPVGAFLLCGGVSKLTHDFNVEKGSSIFARDAAGNPCVNRKRPDDVTYTTFTLTMCRDDPRLHEIMGAGSSPLLTDLGNYPIGYGVETSAACGTVSTRRGVIIELWSELFDCDAPASPYPYQRVVLPNCFLTPKGFDRQDGLSLPVFDGFSVTNPNIGNGPFDDFDLSEDVSGLCYFEFGDDALPTCDSPIDYVALS